MNETEAREQMHEAYQMIKQGQKEDASNLLLGMVDGFSDNAALWWLLANASEGRSDEDLVISLENCYNLQPDHEPNRRKLIKTVRRLRGEGSALAESVSADVLRELGL